VPSTRGVGAHRPINWTTEANVIHSRKYYVDPFSVKKITNTRLRRKFTDKQKIAMADEWIKAVDEFADRRRKTGK
jgi:hypothetical protein